MAPFQEYLNKYTKITVNSLCTLSFQRVLLMLWTPPLNDDVFNLLYSLTTFITKNGPQPSIFMWIPLPMAAMHLIIVSYFGASYSSETTWLMH